MTNNVDLNTRPEPDQVLLDIAGYVCDPKTFDEISASVVSPQTNIGPDVDTDKQNLIAIFVPCCFQSKHFSSARRTVIGPEIQEYWSFFLGNEFVECN